MSPQQGHGPQAHSKKVTTQAGVFRTQLHGLITTLDKTGLHYIRTIKSNSEKAAGIFEGKLVFDQLRYSGVFEAILIRRRVRWDGCQGLS